MPITSVSPADYPSRAGVDIWLLLASRAVRMFAYGSLSVVLGLYLQALGYTGAAIGLVFTAALVGAALLTLGLSPVADRLGRRRILGLTALLMAAGGLAFGLADSLPLLVAAAVLAVVSPSGGEVGPFLPIEQAALAQAAGDAGRTPAFARYNLVGSLAGALGALAAAVPAYLGFEGLAGYRLLVWAYAGAGLILLGIYWRLSPAVEAPLIPGRDRPILGLHRSGRTVASLCGLFALDAFAGGFVAQSFVALWFHLRFGVDADQLGPLFFGTNLCSALSYPVAARLARRFGLLNTMVFTHLPSNLLLMAVPVMPAFPLAALTLLARHLLSQMDVPTRQSYTMAVVDPDERSAAAGLTAVARTAGSAISPVFAGFALTAPAIGLPFLVAGLLKSAYDLALFARFRGLKPPEELKS
jgi:MFS family permease